MKKRTLKKWIPKDTIYCYHNSKYGHCKFYVENIDSQVYQTGEETPWNDGYCKLLKVPITDMCKACNVSTSGWFKMNDYTGCSSHFFKKLREWTKKCKAVDNFDFM